MSKSNELQGKSDSRFTAEEIGNICNTAFKIVLQSCHPPSRLTIRIIRSLPVGHIFQEPFPDFIQKCSHWNKLTQMRDDCSLFPFLLMLLTSWGNCLWKRKVEGLSFLQPSTASGAGTAQRLCGYGLSRMRVSPKNLLAVAPDWCCGTTQVQWKRSLVYWVKTLWGVCASLPNWPTVRLGENEPLHWSLNILVSLHGVWWL